MHVITGLHVGGAESMLYKLLQATDKNKFQPIVVPLINGGPLYSKIEDLGIPVHSLGMKSGINLFHGMNALKKQIKIYQPHLIQGWMYHANVLSQLTMAFSRFAIPVLWNIRHSHYGNEKDKLTTSIIIKMGSFLSHQAVRIVYNSYLSAKQHEKIGYDNSKTVVIPNGFDTDRYHPSQEARIKLRKEFNLDEDTLLIGMVARYHPVKDHDTFLQAASHLHDIYPNVHFILVGRGIDLDNKVLAARIKELGILEVTHLLGEQSDTSMITAALDIATLTSVSEGFPNVVGEAMACGIPCVVTDVGDSSIVVGPEGIVVPVQSPDAIVNGWKKLIMLERKDREEVGKEARKRVVSNFSIDEIVKMYEDMYLSF